VTVYLYYHISYCLFN